MKPFPEPSMTQFTLVHVCITSPGPNQTVCAETLHLNQCILNQLNYFSIHPIKIMLKSNLWTHSNWKLKLHSKWKISNKQVQSLSAYMTTWGECMHHQSKPTQYLSVHDMGRNLTWKGYGTKYQIQYRNTACTSFTILWLALEHQSNYTIHITPYPYSFIRLLELAIVGFFNTLRLRHNGRCFTEDVFKCIFLPENVWNLIKVSLRFVPKGPINNSPALIQVMAWRRSGDKPLSEPMMVSLLTQICHSASMS